MRIIGDGFLSEQGAAEARRLLAPLHVWVAAAENSGNMCHHALETAAVEKQSTSKGKQQTIACVVIARLLEISEALILLSKAGFGVEVNSVFRNFLDAYFIFGNVCKDPAFIREYFDTDLAVREKLMSVSSKHIGGPFRLTNEYATDARRAELKAQIQATRATETNSYNYARNIGCEEIYDSFYRLTSATTHSSPRSLAAYVTEAADGVITAVHRRPQVGDIASRLDDIASLLLHVYEAFASVFEVDVSAQLGEARTKLAKLVVA